MGNGDRMGLDVATELIARAAVEDPRYPEASFVYAEAKLLEAQKQISHALRELGDGQTLVAAEFADRADRAATEACAQLNHGNVVEIRQTADAREKGNG